MSLLDGIVGLLRSNMNEITFPSSKNILVKRRVKSFHDAMLKQSVSSTCMKRSSYIQGSFY